MAPVSWRIAQIRASGENDVAEIPPEGLLLGRGVGCSFALDSAEYPGVSARHARLVFENGTLVLHDEGSRNGTLVHGEPVERFELSHGSGFQLGSGGPRFVVYSSDRLDETVAVPRALARKPTERVMGSQTLFVLRSKLGIPEGADVSQMVHRRGRRNLFLNMAILAALLGAVTFVYYRRHEAVAEDLEAQKEQTQNLAARLEEARRLVELQREAAGEQEARFEDARRSWEAERDRLVGDRENLARSIRRLELEGEADAEDLNRLRGQLETTSQRLDLFDPVNLENERLERVAGFEDVVVLIEADLHWREENGTRRLYFDEDAAGYPTPNLERQGELLERSATGSGFCVSPDGWIITNAHVVLKEEEELDLDVFPEVHLVPALVLYVTFSGKTRRHEATLVQWRRDRRQDLALIKIEPFDDMPHLAGFETGGEKPSPGSDVFLIGFPGGKSILQEGDRMLASTFRGIVSRTVDYYVQIDAAIHPGVSGGPVIDGKGRLVGVVTGMQTLDEVSAASAIGYVIPIREVSTVWPPPPSFDGAD